MSDLYTYLEKDERALLRESMEIVQGKDGDSEAYWNAVSAAYNLLERHPNLIKETSSFYRDMVKGLLERRVK